MNEINVLVLWFQTSFKLVDLEIQDRDKAKSGLAQPILYGLASMGQHIPVPFPLPTFDRCVFLF
jgi:hypothetical protein